MRLKPENQYQARWYVRGEERTMAGDEGDDLIVRGGREKRALLPQEVRDRLHEVEKRLAGRQHYSHVYRGGDKALLDDFKQFDHGKRVILKTIRYRDVDLADRAAVERRRAAFLQEIAVLARGYHFLPEPVDLFTLRNTQDAFLPDAEDLRDSEPVLVYSYQYATHLYYLRNRYPADSFSWSRVARILEQLIAFTAHLHADGFLLQNLTPEHVILGRDDVVRLAGLGGVCRLVAGRVDPAAPNLGRVTRGYCDPALVAGGDLSRMDWRQDMYSLGAVGYYLLTGADPDEGPDEAWLSGQGRALAPALDPDPARRFPSLEAFRTALTTARPPRPSRPARPQTAVFVDVENTSRTFSDANNRERLDFRSLKRQLAAHYPDEELAFTFVAADFGRPGQEGFFKVLEGLGELLRIKPPPGVRGMRQLDDLQLVQALRAQVERVESVIIVSGDGDFLSALEYARERGCRVRQLGFGRPGQALQAAGWVHERIDPAGLGDLSRR